MSAKVSAGSAPRPDSTPSAAAEPPAPALAEPSVAPVASVGYARGAALHQHHPLQARVDDARSAPAVRTAARGELAAVPVPAVDPGVQRVRVRTMTATVRPSVPVSGGATGTARGPRETLGRPVLAGDRGRVGGLGGSGA